MTSKLFVLVPGVGAASLAVILTTMLSSPAQACPETPYVGTMCVTGFRYCPQNYLPADGSTLAVSAYPALYAVIGSTYGGNGSTEFKVPNAQGRQLVGTGRGPSGATPVSVTLGLARGANYATMTPAIMPTHTHTAVFTATPSSVNLTATLLADGNTTSASATIPTSTVSVLAGVPGTAVSARKMWSASATNPVNVGGLTAQVGLNPQSGIAVTNGSAGGGEALVTQSPVLGLYHCIAVNGLFPSSQ